VLLPAMSARAQNAKPCDVVRDLDPSTLVCVGSSVTLNVSFIVNDANATVQWQVSTNGGATFQPFNGGLQTPHVGSDAMVGLCFASPTLTFTPSQADSGHLFRVVVSTGCGTITSKAVTVSAPPTVTLNPVNQTVNPGDPVTFTAAASGSPSPSVQ
jgi:hypothetical protein